MKLSDLKNLPNGYKVNHVTNDIAGHFNYVETERGVNRVFVPYTDNQIYSNWKVSVECKHRGYAVNLWFRIFRDTTGEYSIYFDHAFRPADGRTLRKDCGWNLAYKITKHINN